MKPRDLLRRAPSLIVWIVLLSLLLLVIPPGHALWMKTLGIAGTVNIGAFTPTPTPNPLSATVDIKPDTLNPTGEGEWVTASYIELPEGYDVADIDVSTVLLEGTIPAELEPIIIGDYDSDGVPDLMVKFDRQAVIAYLGDTTGEVTLTVSGRVAGVPFEGSDTITVIRFSIIHRYVPPMGLTIYYSQRVLPDPAATGDGQEEHIVHCLNLDWQDNPEDDLAGYKVYRSLESGGPYDFIAETEESSYPDCGLESGTYFYVVTAFDQAGNESEYSNEASGTVPEPAPIVEPTATETPEPTETVEPSPEPTETVEPTPTEEPTLQPTEEPTATPIPTDTPTPTETPTPTPTSTPQPTATPTEEPTVIPEGEGGQG